MKAKLFTIAVLIVLLSAQTAMLASDTRLPQIEILSFSEGYDPVRYEAGFIIGDAWSELGFDVVVTTVAPSTQGQRVYHEQDFDAALQGWGARIDRLDPHHFLSTMHSDQTRLGGVNPAGYSNPDYDAVFEAQQSELDVEARRELVHEAQAIAAEAQPLTVLYHADEVVAYNNETFENFTTMTGEGIYNEWTPYSVSPLADDRMLTIGKYTESTTINPLYATGSIDWRFLRLVYDKLIKLSADIEPLPWAAESFEAIDDNNIRITLREGMTFHDGEPVTVEDVKFTFDYFIYHEFEYFRAFLEPLAETTIVDEDTINFELETPYAPFITVTLSQIPILPKHIWEGIDEPKELVPDEVPTIGSGPFAFDRWDRGEYKRILKFDDHFYADEMDIDGIEYIFYADSEGRFTGLIMGEIDMIGMGLHPGQISLAMEQDHLSIHNVPSFGYTQMLYNNRREPFDDQAVRQALTMGIDKATIVDVLLDGYGEVGYSVVAPVNFYWHNLDIPRFEYDLDAARQVLEDAGYWWDDEGYLNYPPQ